MDLPPSLIAVVLSVVSCASCSQITYATYIEEVADGDKAKYHKLLESFTDSGQPGSIAVPPRELVSSSLVVPVRNVASNR